MPLVLERCTIRDWREDDAESLALHANDREVWLRVTDRFGHPYKIDNAREFLARTMASDPRTNFAIEVNGAAVGGIGLKLGSDVRVHSAELGYWIGREFWNRGIMTEAVIAVCERAFAGFDLHRIGAFVFSNNPPSARVLEKAGFVFEGRLKHEVVKDGELLDSLVFGKLK
jgi:[ribosomal protein S5]-alanine N-acetyltransferase